jgi:TRAP-type C4-dicarboxylate transport system permease large subunit
VPDRARAAGPRIAAAARRPSGPLKRCREIVVDALWGLVTVVIIMGGILSGVFTADRVGARRLRLRVPGHVPRLSRLQVARAAAPVHRVVKTVAMVMMLIGFSVASAT